MLYTGGRVPLVPFLQYPTYRILQATLADCLPELIVLTDAVKLVKWVQVAADCAAENYRLLRNHRQATAKLLKCHA